VARIIDASCVGAPHDLVDDAARSVDLARR
jgi:hypothetical protein